jgi:hypothetical protein
MHRSHTASAHGVGPHDAKTPAGMSMIAMIGAFMAITLVTVASLTAAVWTAVHILIQ